MQSLPKHACLFVDPHLTVGEFVGYYISCTRNFQRIDNKKAGHILQMISYICQTLLTTFILRFLGFVDKFSMSQKACKKDHFTVKWSVYQFLFLGHESVSQKKFHKNFEDCMQIELWNNDIICLLQNVHFFWDTLYLKNQSENIVWVFSVCV